MANYLQFQISQSCHEDWNKMLPHEKGKFCLSCQKQVVDFTQMSDRQLTDYFKNHKGSTCGRFTGEQLNREIVIPKKPLPYIKYFFQILLPAFLFSFRGAAQTKSRPKEMIPTVEAIQGMMKGEIIGDTTINGKRVVEGVVKDENGNAIPGASVMVKGTSIGVAADSIGYFSLKDIPSNAELIVSCVGYTTRTLMTNVLLSENHIVLNNALTNVLVGYVGGVTVRTSRRRIKQHKKAIKKEECIQPITALSIYPNPVTPSSFIHLKWQGLSNGKHVAEVYDLQGALLQTQEVAIENNTTEYVLKLQLQTAGNYIVRLTNKKTGKGVSQQLLVQ